VEPEAKVGAAGRLENLNRLGCNLPTLFRSGPGRSDLMRCSGFDEKQDCRHRDEVRGYSSSRSFPSRNEDVRGHANSDYSSIRL
jgi:hypothetical protein